MNLCFGLDGAPITFEEWSALFESDQRFVEKTDVGDYMVSTVWLGMVHGFSDGAPLIFETLVFLGAESFECAPDFEDLQRRWATRAEAAAGHAEIVAQLEKRLEGNQ